MVASVERIGRLGGDICFLRFLVDLLLPLFTERDATIGPSGNHPLPTEHREMLLQFISIGVVL